ncbi:MAG TPA: trigger factor [Thermoanaerobaculia bacterium]|nr:trigger factor [Thermoanaerobaculia bacterium]
MSSIESVGPCRKRLHIEVPAPAVDAETMRVIREYGRKVRLPGFRAGKVPPAVVQQRFRAEIEREVLDRLVPRYWKQAQAEISLEPLLPPSVEDVELKTGEPLVFVATVEVRPPIELGDVENFDLPEVETEPTSSEIDEALASLQARVAEWVDVSRPVARGDRVSVETVELDGEGAPLGAAGTVEVEVGSPQVWEELSLALTGLEGGQETEFRRQEEIDGEARVRRFRVKVLGVKERDLPPLDDALAKKVGDFSDLAALRSHVAHRLLHEKERQRRLRQEQAVLEQLRARHPLELPEGVVEEETRGLLQEYAESLGRQGVDIERVSIDWDALAREVRPQAERRVHVRLLLDAVADANEVEVAPQELEERLALLARAQGRTTASVRHALSSGGQLEALRRQMRREKTIESLLPVEEHDHGAGHDDSPGRSEPIP